MRTTIRRLERTLVLINRNPNPTKNSDHRSKSTTREHSNDRTTDRDEAGHLRIERTSIGDGEVLKLHELSGIGPPGIGSREFRDLKNSLGSMLRSIDEVKSFRPKNEGRSDDEEGLKLSSSDEDRSKVVDWDSILNDQRVFYESKSERVPGNLKRPEAVIGEETQEVIKESSDTSKLEEVEEDEKVLEMSIPNVHSFKRNRIGNNPQNFQDVYLTFKR